MESVRGEVREALLKAQVDPAVRMDELDAFIQQGLWPSATPLLVLQRRSAQAAKALSEAYEHCLGSTLESGDVPRARVLRAEMDQWRGLQKQDLASWILIPLPLRPEAGQDESSRTYVLPIQATSPYRLEVEGSAEAVEKLEILAPLPGGGRFPVVVMIEEQRFHAVITVAAAGIPAADLGIERLPDLEHAKVLDGDRVELVARGGTLRFERVRWKALPILEKITARPAAEDPTTVVPSESNAGATSRQSALAGKDDQLEFWAAGTRIKGLRGADVRVDIEGTVVRSDEKGLEVEVVEQWRKNGQTFRPKLLWVYERVGVDPKTGKVALRNVEQKHMDGRVTRSSVEGDVVIDGKELRGDYRFDWRVKGEELHEDDRRRAIEMDVVSSKAPKESAGLLEWLPIGTTLRCKRTRSNGPAETVNGTVVENDGLHLVVEAPGLSGPNRLWKFERTAGGRLRLVEQAKKDPRQIGGVIRNCQADLRVNERGISGDYSWELEQSSGKPETVKGTLTWEVIKRPSGG